MHSVIVSGVEATGDPLSNPNSITAIHVWDPGGGIIVNGNYVGIQALQEVVVSKSQWLSGTIPWSGASYFKYPYAANVYSGKALDPDRRWGHTPMFLRRSTTSGSATMSISRRCVGRRGGP